jgi:diguanylate cyclase (GGDEF)-like protein/PAS domain S-box-containing protein
MWIKYFDRIAVRLIFNITLVATIIASISAYIFFEQTYKAELEQTRTSLQQLVQAVSHTAAIASYLGDVVLAEEVVQGIAANDLVKAVVLKTESKVIASKGDISAAKEQDLMRFSLNSPFVKTERVGELMVNVNYHLIETYAKNAAKEHVVLITIHSFVLIFIIMLLLKYQLVDVINNLVRKLHVISPGSGQRLEHSAKHVHDEIGLLEVDINRLLNSVEFTIDRERSLRAEVEELERRFRGIFEQTSGGIALIDHQGYLKVHNPAFEKMIGSKRMQRLTANLKESLFSVIDVETLTLQNAVSRALKDNAPVSVDLKIFDNDNIDWLHCMITKVVDDSDVPVVEIIIQDVSERRNREHSLKIQAELDPLTGLYNRRAGKQKIQSLLDDSQNLDIEYALLMIDLDNFKPINDQYGHKAGDLVLTTLAKRFIKHVRSNDIIIRWGGDEILIFIMLKNHDLNINTIIEKLNNLIKQPIIIDEAKTVTIGASIGYAIFPLNGFELDLLIHRADVAMYLIKSDAKQSTNISITKHHDSHTDMST